jgi:membrane-bound lytic murein transglycosylase B
MGAARRRATWVALVLVATGCAGGGAGRGAGPAAPTTAPATTAPAQTSAPAPPETTTTVPVDVNALRPPAPAGDPAGLAAQIAVAEGVLRTPGTADGGVAAAALAQQVAYRQLGDHPEWDAAVLAALPPELVPAAQSHVAARREFRALLRAPAPDVPAWRIVAPAPADELAAYYHEAEAASGVPWNVLAAVNLVESGMGRIRGTSTAGAQGPMQFLPSTWAAYGEGDVNDYRASILAAGRYLAANGAPANLDGALWHYNHNDHYVRGVELYAHLIAEHPGAFAGFYHWGVWYTSTAGDLFLPVGYEQAAPVPVEQYLASAPR